MSKKVKTGSEETPEVDEVAEGTPKAVEAPGGAKPRKKPSRKASTRSTKKVSKKKTAKKEQKPAPTDGADPEDPPKPASETEQETVKETPGLSDAVGTRASGAKAEGPIARAVREQAPPEEDGVAGGVLAMLLSLLASLGAFLWSAQRRPYTIAVGAALLLVFGWRLGGDADAPPGDAAEAATEGTASAGSSSHQPKLADEARLQISAGDPLGAARRLEPEVTRTDRSGGDAELHAALAHAYAQAGWGADAVPHFEWTARKDPSVLREEDLRDLVRLLGLPGAKPEAVQAALITAGRRSVPMLEEVWDDPRAPVLVRRRAGEVLQRVGEDVALIPFYRALLERGACPARKEAVARLAAATDDAAADLLQEVSASGRCGAAEARRALGQ